MEGENKNDAASFKHELIADVFRWKNKFKVLNTEKKSVCLMAPSKLRISGFSRVNDQIKFLFTKHDRDSFVSFYRARKLIFMGEIENKNSINDR